MDRLDACYFCGTAGDAPLREVSIAPRARRGDPDATVAVTLCSRCEGKLQTLLGRLFDNVESRLVEDTGDDAASGGADAGDGDAASADGDGDDAAEAGADGGTAATDDAGQPVDRIDVSGGVGDGPGAGDRQPPVDPATTDDAPSGASGADASDATTADPAEQDAEVVADDEPTVRARASTSAGDTLDGVSVAEYNRVVRLLQNREFPMAREAFVDLASSAYDLESGTVQQVLDAVVDRGVLAERDGDLVRPGGSGAAGGSGGEPS